MAKTQNRRRQPRVDVALPAHVRIVTSEFDTETINVSDDGVYFVLRSAMTLEVQIKGVRRRGRLVRIESRTSAHDELGFAVRLDPPGGAPSRY
jgi:hypothetical protein